MTWLDELTRWHVDGPKPHDPPGGASSVYTWLKTWAAEIIGAVPRDTLPAGCIRLELPAMSINDWKTAIALPDLAKKTPRNVQGYGARILVSREGRAYAADIEAAYRRQVGLRPPLECDLILHIIWRRDRRIGDVDNVVKPLQDALAGLAFVNDKQIAEIRARRSDATLANPGLSVIIEPIGGDLALARQGALFEGEDSGKGARRAPAGAQEAVARSSHERRLVEHGPIKGCARFGLHECPVGR